MLDLLIPGVLLELNKLRKRLTDIELHRIRDAGSHERGINALVEENNRLKQCVATLLELLAAKGTLTATDIAPLLPMTEPMILEATESDALDEIVDDTESVEAQETRESESPELNALGKAAAKPTPPAPRL